MRKALIIGAGGTGTRVLVNIANIINARQKKNINELKHLEYYEIDTEFATGKHLSIPGSDLNYQHLMVDENQNNVFQQQRKEGKHSWMDRDYCKDLEPITDGAHATRVVGKYAFLQHYDKIYGALTTRLQRLRDLGAEQQGKTQVYIIANTASGTGSGCFVDLGIMVRDIIKKQGFNVNNANLRVTLIVTLPTDYSNDRNMNNAYFALQELNHFMMGKPYEIDHVNGRTRITFDGGRIFDYVYIIGRRDVADTNVAPLENIISEYIYNDIYSSSADVRDAARDNLRLVRGKGRGQKPLYMSFGLSVIEYPSSNILEAASCEYIENTLSDWLKPSDKNISLKYAGNYFETGIFLEIINPCQPSGETSILDYNSKLEATKGAKTNSFNTNPQGKYNVKYLEELKTAFDNGFNLNTGTTKNINPLFIRDGDFQQILDINLKRLIIEIPQNIKEEILKILFSGDVENNIDYAIKSVSKIIEKIQGLQKTNEKDLTRHEKWIKNAYNNISSMKKIALLPRAFKTIPIDRYFKDFETNFNKYTKDKIYNASLKKMKEKIQFGSIEVDFLTTLENHLRVFLENIISLQTSIENWKNKIHERFNEVIKTPSVNGHVVNSEKIAELSNFAVVAYDDSEKRISKLISIFLKYKYENGLKKNEQQSFNYTNDDVFSEIKNLHKSHMQAVNVIDVFLNELKTDNKIASDSDSLSFAYEKVREINDKSKPYLAVETRDDAFVIDKNLEKRLAWVFYPDGKEIKTPETAISGNNKFAKILKETYIIEDGRWNEMSQSSNDAENRKDMILFLKEIGVFPIRFLDILSDTRMKTALNAIDKSDSTRIDLKYLPLIPPSKDEYNGMKNCLIKSIALKSIIPIAGEQKFVINKTLIDRGLTVEEKDFILPIRYEIAIAELSDSADLREVLNSVFVEVYRDAVNDSTKLADFLECLYELKLNPGKLGLIANEDDIKEIDKLIHDEILRKSELKSKWNEMYPDNQIVESTIRRIKIRRSTGNDSGFYCQAKIDSKECGQWLGGLQEEDIVRALTECPNCQNRLIYDFA